jgi:hypothetical protein
MKCKRLPELCPNIERPSEFAARWKQWWVKMQPSWCAGESLIRILPVDTDWEPILCAGPNGLSLVILILSWWIHGVKDREVVDRDLCNAIDDVNWVIMELLVVAAAYVDGSKRAHEDAEEAQEG